MKYIIVAFFFFFLLGCNSEKEYHVLNNLIDLRNDNFMNSYGIYALGNEKLPIAEEIENFFKELLPEYIKYEHRNERRSNHGFYVEKVENLHGLLTPPYKDYLDSFGKELSDLQKDELQKCENIVTLTFYGGNNKTIQTQNEIHTLISRILKNKNYVLVDFATLEYFNASSWENRRVRSYDNPLDVDVTKQVLFKITKNDSTACRIVSFGMEKFCLPDFSISDFPCNKTKDVKGIIELITQQIFEKPFMNKDSTIVINENSIRNQKWSLFLKNEFNNDSLRIGLKVTKPILGDKNNKQFAINFDSKDKQSDVIARFSNNTIKYVSSDKKIIQASERAKIKLPKLKEAYNAKKLIDDFVLLKAPFISKEKKEWMWVEVTEWNGQTITGKLYNSSQIFEHLKSGVLVSIDQQDIFDYIIKKEDGSFEGNETEKLIRKATQN